MEAGLVMKNTLHRMVAVPEGKTLSELLSSVTGLGMEIIISKPNEVCAGCRKPFNEARKRRKIVRLHPTGVGLPLIFSCHICGRCQALHEKGGAGRDGLLAAIQAYCEGIKAKQ